MPAAGVGRRFGEALPKQYVELCGRTVLEWALAPFLGDSQCAGIVVAISPEDRYFADVSRRLNAESMPLAASPQGKSRGDARRTAPDSTQQSRLTDGGPAAKRGESGPLTVDGSRSEARVQPLATVQGGAERSHSVRNALRALEQHAGPNDWVLVHDAARPCLPPRDLDALLTKIEHHAVGGLLATRAADTLKRAADDLSVNQTVDRSDLWRALTPQMFRYSLLCQALDSAIAHGRLPTDEAQAIEWAGQQPVLVEGSAENIKVTHAQDLVLAEALLRARAERLTGRVGSMRVGSGIDVHAFGPGDSVMLGGVRIPYSHGVVAHSDGDVILHALCDALLGASGLGDIGQHFRDDDPQWRGADSKRFATAVLAMLKERGLRVGNADVTVLAEGPRLARYRTEIRRTIAELLEVPESHVNVKATTTERLGFIGRSEGLAAQAIVALVET
jgi:2-C-methyl-D-erythritol 2,4-cyclodiphosphate synthase/2-C-methyl-D-erythritol 4-phosphate cytidylyltransferase